MSEINIKYLSFTSFKWKISLLLKNVKMQNIFNIREYVKKIITNTFQR